MAISYEQLLRRAPKPSEPSGASYAEQNLLSSVFYAIKNQKLVKNPKKPPTKTQKTFLYLLPVFSINVIIIVSFYILLVPFYTLTSIK